jgi:hypothetical protein
MPGEIKQWRDSVRREDAPRPVRTLRGYVAPRGGWVPWFWLVYWIVALVPVVFLIMTIAGWEHGTPAFGLLVFLFWVVGGCGWLYWRKRRQRVRGIAKFARLHEFAYRPELTKEELEGLVPPLPLFAGGKDRYATNVMAGVYHDVPLMFMDFTFTLEVNKLLATAAGMAGIPLGDGQYPEVQTVVIFRNLPRRMPRFRLVSKRLRDKSVSRLLEKVDDLCVADDDAFAAAYAVEGEPADTVRKVFSPRIQEYFGRNPTWYIECEGQDLIVFRPAAQCSAANVAKRLQTSIEMMRTLLRL